MKGKRLAIIAAILFGAWLILRQGDLTPPTARLDEAELVRIISHGERVLLRDHVAKQGWTIVEFSADW